MKKAMGLILVFMLTLGLFGCNRVLLSPNAEGKVIYNYDGISFEDDLTDEEVQAVVQVLEGKERDTGFLQGIPSCGFDTEIAIIIGGRKFALACDGCGTVQDLGALGYIHISGAEQDILEKIFTSRGGEFPCI